MPAPTTAVIGAGISGLTTAKMLGDYGIPYTCFETSDRIGGNWAFGNPNGHSSAYRSLHIDTSKHQLSFKDYPMPDEYPDFPHHTQIKAYLDGYARAFDLEKNIEFRNGVVHAEPVESGGWDLDLEDGSTRHTDFLVVANGHHWDPRMAEFPGEFTGTEIHSHHYIDPQTPLDFTGRRILVVGLGNSAADIAVELSSKTLGNEVTLSTRSGAWIVPKYIAGRPADKYYRTSPYVPLAWQRKAAQLGQPLLSGRPERYGLPTPNHRFFEAHPTQSVELPLRLGSGDVTPKPDVRLLDGRTVHFEDGTSSEFDIIVHATGYNITFPFFDEDFISAPGNRIDLYKRIFAPGIDDLAFAGFAQATPTLFPFVESQARLIAAYAAGRYRLPPIADMRRVIAEDQQKYTGHMLDRPRHTQQVDYFLYEHDLRTREIPEGAARADLVAAAPPDDRCPSSTESSSYRSVAFDSSGTPCDAWYFRASDDRLANDRGRPIVVMAHGLGGTKDSGLQPFAQRLADAGLDVFAFDYRGFGSSGGAVRQRVDVADQLDDYRAALSAAAALDGVDPGRVALWGVSLSGGHVLAVAAGRTDVAAVVSMTPLVDGRAAAVTALRHHSVRTLARSAATGLRSRVGALTGRTGTTIAVVGRPGETAALSLDGYFEDYTGIAGPTWRNEIDANITMQLGSYRPAKQAKNVRCPVLMQIADFDRSAPPHSAALAGFAARAEVRHYPCDHFGLYAGHRGFDAAVEHQILFLSRHLGTVPDEAAEVAAAAPEPARGRHAAPTTRR